VGRTDQGLQDEEPEGHRPVHRAKADEVALSYQLSERSF
jgi:hypothetical protein